MYQSAPKKFKTTILAQVANQYPLGELREAGFDTGITRYRSAQKKARLDNFALTGYSRTMPPSRKNIEEITKNLVVDILQRCSRPSGKTIRGVISGTEEV